MNVTQNVVQSPPVSGEAEIFGASEELNDDLRAMRALRLLLESRMIDHTEYERRLASFKRRLALGAENLAIADGDEGDP